MKGAGQFLLGPGDFSGSLHLGGVIGVCLLVCNLVFCRRALVARLTPGVSGWGYFCAVSAGGLCAVVCTICMTWSALHLRASYSPVLDAGASAASVRQMSHFVSGGDQRLEEGPGGRSDGIGGARSGVPFLKQVLARPTPNTGALEKGARSIGVPDGSGGAIPLAAPLNHLPPKLLEAQRRHQDEQRKRRDRIGITLPFVRQKGGVLLLAVLFIVGAGYASTLAETGFVESCFAMSAGIGLPEEMMKALVGILLLYRLCDAKGLGSGPFYRAVLCSFGVAGIGFGAIEALRYFVAYASTGEDLWVFAVRALWCVLLHGSWTLIVGALLAAKLPQDWGSPGDSKGVDDRVWVALVKASVPAAIVHGIYDACCKHGSGFMWLVGGISLGVAWWLVERSADPKEAVAVR